jgi:hypothetical protein
MEQQIEEWKTYLIFYADTPKDEKNKLFKWDIVSIVYWRERLKYFIKKGFFIRAAFVEEINTKTGEVTNTRIQQEEIQSLIDELLVHR